ncbi:MAG: molybdopterin-binding protein [Syntrophales bacterium]
MELELFEKTEIWISPIHIVDVDLGLIAEKFAGILHLDKKEIMVVDVREELITLDVLKKSVRAEDIIGKKDALLKALAAIPGVSLTPETSLHSDGILGLIAVENQEMAGEILGGMERMQREISERIRKRAIVFPSGFEVRRGMIQDTNSPYIRNRLMKEGYSVTVGDTLEDDVESIVPVLRRALSEGYGLIITTGGVGAEDKDRMVEALLRIDPEASTPYIIRYEKGKGRHEKDGVKIGVAYLQPSYVIALPGPHEEVKAGMDVVIGGLKKGQRKEDLASALAKEYVGRLKLIHHLK